MRQKAPLDTAARNTLSQSMLSDDVYITKFRATVADLEAWLKSLSAVAAIETHRDEATWRASVVPNVIQACPFELMLRLDQRFDLTVGPETYEDQAIANMEMFMPLLAAVANGRLVTSTWSTADTGMIAAIETKISPEGGIAWSSRRTIRTANSTDHDALIQRDHHYIAYARGA